MLYSLKVIDLLLIDKLAINFQNGLTVVTGETGAGKSMLLKAINLACGSRGDASLIRPKCEKSLVEIVFDLSEFKNDHPVWALLSDVEQESTFLKISRTILANGRSKVFINDQPSTLAHAKKISSHLMTIFGQFDEPLEENLHVMWLDAWLPESELTKCHPCYENYVNARLHYLNFLNEKETLEETRSYLLGEQKILEDLDPKPHEESELLIEKREISHLGKSADTLTEILDDVYKKDALSALHSATGKIERLLSDEDNTLQNLFHCFHTSSLELEAGMESIRSILENTQDAHRRYQEIDERVHQLRNAAVRFKCEPDKLFEKRQVIQEKLLSIDNFEQDFLEATKQYQKERDVYLTQARVLHNIRAEVGQKLSQAMMHELKDLKLEQVKFRVRLDEKPEEKWHALGIDDVTFEVETNPGMGFSPLNDIASGGELSRLALALQITMQSVLPSSTLLFDEIDTGVGGAVSNAIGSRLKKLSSITQVFTITHAPQVAVWADQHLVVSKTKGNDPKSTLVLLNENERVDELARMLSGDNITDEAIKASKALFRGVEQCASS